MFLRLLYHLAVFFLIKQRANLTGESSSFLLLLLPVFEKIYHLFELSNCSLILCRCILQMDIDH